MKTSTPSSTRRFVFARSLCEASAFLAAAALVATSAALAKQSAFAPALAAIDGAVGGEAPVQALIAAAPAPAGPVAEAVIEDAAAQAEPEVEIEVVELVDQEIRYFDGRACRPVRTITMVTTAYSPDERSCGKWADGITASNKSVWTNGMKLAAADTRLLPFGTLISVPGYDEGRIIPVLDRGGAIKGNRLDLLYPTHEIALQWGVRRLAVTVWEYVD